MWNCSLLLTTFSISLSVVLRRTMGQKELGVLCEVLFGLGITTELANLKWEGQYSNVMQALAICINFSRHVLCEITALRCLHDTWSGPGVEDDEHLAIASLNSWLEKGGYLTLSAWGSLLRSLVLTSLFSAELYDLCRAFHRSRRVLHGRFSYKMNSMAGRDFFLTQLIRSQGLLLDDAILWILLSKNSLLTVHTTDLNSFQCLSSPDSQYLLRPLVQSWFHHSLECFVMHFCLEWVFHAFSKIFASCWTEASRFAWLLIADVSRLWTPWTNEEMNSFSSSLSFLIDHMLMLVLTSPMPISMMRGTWLDGLQISGWSVCRPNPVLFGRRKTRSMTELVSRGLSTNLVGPGFEGGIVWDLGCLQ